MNGFKFLFKHPLNILSIAAKRGMQMEFLLVFYFGLINYKFLTMFFSPNTEQYKMFSFLSN